MRYFLVGTVGNVNSLPLDIHEEFSSPGDAHCRWDDLRAKYDNCQLKLTERNARPKSRLTLAQKIFKISREAGIVQRRGVAENNGTDKESRPLYAFTRIEDVLTVVHPLLIKYKLIAYGQVTKDVVTHVIRGGAATTEMSVEWTLEDTVTGESRTWRIPGSGSDENGKGSYRSLTGSRKYFYVIVFNLQFGDEPEEVQHAESRVSSGSDSHS